MNGGISEYVPLAAITAIVRLCLLWWSRCRWLLLDRVLNWRIQAM